MALPDSEKYSHGTYQQTKAGGPSDFTWKSLRDQIMLFRCSAGCRHFEDFSKAFFTTNYYIISITHHK
jgi:hypothetical protein